jgi:hypothetical protein
VIPGGLSTSLIASTDSAQLLRPCAPREIHDGLHEGPRVDRLGQVHLKSRLDRVLAVLFSRE